MDITPAAVLDSLPAHVALLNSGGEIFEVNHQWSVFAEANGLVDPDHLACVGTNYLRVCDNAGGEGLRVGAGIRAILAGDRPLFTHVYTCHSTAERRWFRLDVTPLELRNGTGAIATHWNITAKHLAEKLQLDLGTIVNSSRNAIIGKRLDGIVTVWNAGAERIFGYAADEIIGQSIASIIPADRVEEEAEILLRIRAGETVEQLETIRIAKDGSHVDVSITVAPIRDEAQTVVGAYKIVRDVTVERRALDTLLASEYWYRQIVETAHEGIWTVDREGRTNFTNQRMRDLIGYSEAEMHGRPFTDFVAEDVRGHEDAFASYKPGIGEQIETTYRRKDGTLLHALLAITPYAEEQGGGLAMVTDIGDRKRAENEVALTTQRLASAIDALRQLATATGSSSELIDLAVSKCQDVCCADGAIIGIIDGSRIACIATAGIGERVQGRSLRIDASMAGQVLSGGRAIMCDDTETAAIVDIKTAHLAGVRSMITAPIRTDAKNTGVIAVISATPHAFEARDVSNLELMAESIGALMQRRVAGEELRSSAEDYRVLFEHNPQPMWVYDLPSLRFLAVNESAVKHYGWSEAEFLEMTIADLRPAAERVRAWDCGLPVGRSSYEPVEQETRDGKRIMVAVTADDITFRGRPARLVAAEDVTDREEAALELARINRALAEQASLLDRARDAITVRDLDDVITYWNKGAERVYGWTADEAVGRTVTALLGPDETRFSEGMRALLASGEWSGEMTQVNRAGENLAVEVRWTLLRDDLGEPATILSIATDVTDRHKLEQQFLRAQRMESLGTLAGGIAHDLNNVLAPIMMSVAMLRSDTQDPETIELLDTLAASAQRAADMVRQVLYFARGVEGQRVTVNLPRVLHEVEKIARDTFPKNVVISTTLSRHLWSILGDATQVHQVVLNLCVNARDAMPDGGDLLISAENVRLDAHYAALNIDARSGPHVVITVRDTGSGIPSGILERIFEPFFTTKEIGHGTGLGLSTCQAIVKSHGGFMRAYSEAGRGSKFQLYLPADSVSEADTAEPELPPQLPTGNGELVLLVDDEASIRQVTQQTLETFGYRVMVAADGAEAVAMYAMNVHQIDVVITDMMMPILDGRATIAALVRINPDVRIIAASGGISHDRFTASNLAGVKHYLAKPFTADTLLKALREVLETP